MANGDIQQESPLLNRPISSNGLPIGLGGIIQQNVNGSVTPVDFYIEALEGERISVARAIINIQSATNIGPNEYGDLLKLTNGIQLFIRVASLGGIRLNLSDGLPIQQNEDWGRWCFDSKPIPIGPTQQTQTWQARWSFTKYGNPWGIVLEEGDQLGIVINDDLTGLVSHTLIMEGVHLGAIDPRWIDPF